jgi:hypothetical protein
MDKSFIKKLLERTAEEAIGASALRNQGGPGIVQAARDSLKKIKINTFIQSSEDGFNSALNNVTVFIKSSFPHNMDNWGAARKAINLFLRDVAYSKYLNEYFELDSIIPFLEIPLDSYTALWICKEYEHDLPKWNGIKNLKHDDSDCFQKAAAVIAEKRKIKRVDLDILYWRNRNITNTRR